jgi:hypothetical protein
MKIIHKTIMKNKEWKKWDREQEREREKEKLSWIFDDDNNCLATAKCWRY